MAKRGRKPTGRKLIPRSVTAPQEHWDRLDKVAEKHDKPRSRIVIESAIPYAERSGRWFARLQQIKEVTGLTSGQILESSLLWHTAFARAEKMVFGSEHLPHPWIRRSFWGGQYPEGKDYEEYAFTYIAKALADLSNQIASLRGSDSGSRDVTVGTDVQSGPNEIKEHMRHLLAQGVPAQVARQAMMEAQTAQFRTQIGKMLDKSVEELTAESEEEADTADR